MRGIQGQNSILLFRSSISQWHCTAVSLRNLFYLLWLACSLLWGGNTPFYNYKLQYSILIQFAIITFCLSVTMVELRIALPILPLYFVYYVFPNGYLCFIMQFSCSVTLFSCSVTPFSCAVTLSSSCATPRGPSWTCEDSERKLTVIQDGDCFVIVVILCFPWNQWKLYRK